MKISHCKECFLILCCILLCGCMGTLPEGEVPESLVGTQMTDDSDSVPLKDAEASMSGAIVRALVRSGHSSERVPMAFTENSQIQNGSFVQLLHGTGMIRIGKPAFAVYFIESQMKNGVWNLRLLKKDGTVMMKKTVKYRMVKPQ